MTIAIAKYRDIETQIALPQIKIHCKIGLRKGKNLGHIDANTGLWIPGREVVTGEVAPFDNIITNLGLNNIADNLFSDLAAYVHCGTGTTAEVAGDTALETFVAATNTFQESANETAQGSAPYYGKVTYTKRFAQGAAEGNISEIGFSNQATTGNLFSRALVKDGGGSPTTISVLSDEWLDVSYEFRLYPDHILSGGGADDGAGSVDYDATTYNYTIRPANVTNYLHYKAYSTRGQLKSLSSAYGVAYGSDGALGAATSTPTGTSTDAILTSGASISAATYSNGTYNRDVSLVVGLNEGNVTGGIKALMFYSGMGSYQIAFNNPVPKDNTKVWTFVTNLAWARATIP